MRDDEPFANPSGWSFTTIASWDFWEWGRTKYGESAKRRRLSQAKIARQKTIDQARLEVEVSYLKAHESEKNILAVEKAVEQAKENLRITDERYKEQVAILGLHPGGPEPADQHSGQLFQRALRFQNRQGLFTESGQSGNSGMIDGEEKTAIIRMFHVFTATTATKPPWSISPLISTRMNCSS